MIGVQRKFYSAPSKYALVAPGIGIPANRCRTSWSADRLCICYVDAADGSRRHCRHSPNENRSLGILGTRYRWTLVGPAMSQGIAGPRAYAASRMPAVSSIAIARCMAGRALQRST